MKHGKKPTKQQKAVLNEFHLNPNDWLIVKNTAKEMQIISRFTGRIKVIPKPEVIT